MNEHQASKPLIYDLSLELLSEHLRALGEPAYRARQIWEGLYQHLWREPDEFTNLPASLRNTLAETFRFEGMTPLRTLKSSDGETIKILFRLDDGHLIETVRMRYLRRRTLCISTQSGCAMGCVFCATAKMGLQRHLTSGEITAQVIYFARLLKAGGEKVTNVVLMGMGEPFHNYDNTMAAIDRLNDSDGLNLGARRFTISTVGLIPAIRRFTAEKRQVNLAISLHAADDDLRGSMLPVNRRYPISELMKACEEYVAQSGRRLTFEWALIRDVNDSPAVARQLAELLRPLVRGGAAMCHVNVIPLNPTAGYEGQATTRERAEAFQTELGRYHIPCTIRIRRGIDIQAGCGQLAAHQLPGESDLLKP